MMQLNDYTTPTKLDTQYIAFMPLKTLNDSQILSVNYVCYIKNHSTTRRDDEMSVQKTQKYYIIKRVIEGNTMCPFFKELSTWVQKIDGAKHFEDAIDAEYTRRHLDGDNKLKTYICEVELITREVVVQIQLVGTRD
jgi:hypothetical protein